MCISKFPILTPVAQVARTVLCSALLFLPGTLFAQDNPDDFFQLDRDEVERRIAVREAKETGEQLPAAVGNPGEAAGGEGFSINGLFGAMGPSGSENEEQRDSWGEFEDISGTKAERSFRESKEMKIREELSKPLPKRKSVTDDDVFDHLERSIQELDGEAAEEEDVQL